MKVWRNLAVVLMATGFVAAQAGSTAATPKRTKKRAAATTAVSQSDLQALKDQLAAQQQQIQQLMDEVRQRDAAFQQAQQQMQQNHAAAAEAQSKATAAAQAAEQSNANATQLATDIKDVKANATNAALTTQEEQKKLSALESALGRFRWTGDVRVRGESFFQKGAVDRNRARIRLRLGVEGDPNQDFTGGLYIASGFVTGSGGPAGAVGSVANPVSANDTLSNFFERKAISFDRGFIVYHPQAWKWLRLTGGKFAYDFPRTDITFDPDLNPEGFTEKFSFDFHNPIFKNVTVEGMELLFNEVAGSVTGSGASLKINRGVDSNAVGGYGSATLQFGPWKTTPSIMVLNWNGADPIAQAVSPVGLCPTNKPGQINCIFQPNTPAAGQPLPNPVSTPSAFLQTNPMTNATRVVGSGTGLTRAFVSGFEYADFIWDNSVTTPWKRFPWNFRAEYEQNLRARLNVGFAPSKQDKAYWLDTSLGQQKNKHDLQVGYSWWRVEQDAVISSFVQDDQRGPTNNLQNRFYANYLLTPSTTAGFTWWNGRTLNTNLQNALLAPGVTKGLEEPRLNRFQFDLIYKF
jgi:hypothetical protein